AHREDVTLDAADEERVRRLLAHEALAPAAVRDPLRLHDLVRGERRRPEVADLPDSDEIRQRAQRLVDVDVRVGTMDLVQVDPVGLQPPQAVVYLGNDPASR